MTTAVKEALAALIDSVVSQAEDEAVELIVRRGFKPQVALTVAGCKYGCSTKAHKRVYQRAHRAKGKRKGKQQVKQLKVYRKKHASIQSHRRETNEANQSLLQSLSRQKELEQELGLRQRRCVSPILFVDEYEHDVNNESME